MNDNFSTTETSLGHTKNSTRVNVRYSRIKRKLLSHVTAIRVFIICLTLGFVLFVGLLIAHVSKYYNAPLYFNSAYNFFAAPVSLLASDNGRTNILIMGKAGGAHDGPELTDTMMLVSVSIKGNDIKIISIPRDIWVPEIRAKINSAYYWGTQKTPYWGNQKSGNGINFAKAEASAIVGVPIHYGAVIDFSGFKDVIDKLGGIEVDVTNSFTDYYYPIAGRENDTCGGDDPEFMCRYETLRFAQGRQFMDGATALKFVRSRHAEGLDGTDTAREARQGKVINAIKDKLSSKDIYKNPKKVIAIFNVVKNSIQMDIDYPTAAIIARRFYDSKDSIKSFLIPSDLLLNPPVSEKYDKQSVFTPKAGDGKWKDINAWVGSILN